MLPEPSLQVVHLQIAAQQFFPDRIRRENGPRVREGKEVTPQRRRTNSLARLLQPGPDSLGNERPDAFELEEGPRVLRPEESIAGGSLKGALPNAFLALRFPGEKLGDFAIR